MSNNEINDNVMNPGMGMGINMGVGSMGNNGSMGRSMGNMNVGQGGGGMKRSSQNLGFDDEVYY